MSSETCYLVCQAGPHGAVPAAVDTLVFKYRETAEIYAYACRNHPDNDLLATRYAVFPIPLCPGMQIEMKTNV